MKIHALTQWLETIAPPQYQEAYDNAGLIVGDANQEISGVLVCLDSIEAVIDEAIALGCNVVVAHHPIVFKGMKKLNGRNYVERTVIKAIKNDIAIYAIHTNLDNVLRRGVNEKIAQKLGLKDVRILAPKRQILTKLTTFCPKNATQAVLDALYAAGAGHIGNYENCSFRTEGTGTFRPTGNANPHIGSLNQDESVIEDRVEVIFPSHLSPKIVAAMRAAHPYEEVAYYLTALENTHQEVGSGVVGTLAEGMDSFDFLHFLKEKMQTACVRHTHPLSRTIKKVAICGGAGSFLLGNALGAGADVFVTADYKYHEFFDAEGRILIADIGHFESEQFTIELLVAAIKEKVDEIPIFSTKINTNPVKYL